MKKACSRRLKPRDGTNGVSGNALPNGKCATALTSGGRLRSSPFPPSIIVRRQYACKREVMESGMTDSGTGGALDVLIQALKLHGRGLFLMRQNAIDVAGEMSVKVENSNGLEFPDPTLADTAVTSWDALIQSIPSRPSAFADSIAVNGM